MVVAPSSDNPHSLEAQSNNHRHRQRSILYSLLILITLKVSVSSGFIAECSYLAGQNNSFTFRQYHPLVLPPATVANKGGNYLQVRAHQSKLMQSKGEQRGESKQIITKAEMTKMYSNVRTISQLLQSNSHAQNQNLLPTIFRKSVPPLSTSSHKGSSGRVAILGGSEKYTGAPYYAAMASLRTGADLATVYCAQEASTAIKTYSPELMVDPVYEANKMQQNDLDKSEQQMLVQDMVQKVLGTLGRMHALVIGPGLGRDPLVLDATAEIISEALNREINMVLDADALYLLSLEKYSWLVESIRQKASSSNSIIALTPNVVEYKRLVDGISNGSEGKFMDFLPGVVVVRKGLHDVIRRFPVTDSDTFGEGIEVPEMVCEEQGGLKRSGGIGDILAGSIGTFLAWNRILTDRNQERKKVEEKDDEISDAVLSCWMGCSITKRATMRAFKKRKRSMTAPDVLDEVGEAFDEVESQVDDDSISDSSPI